MSSRSRLVSRTIGVFRIGVVGGIACGSLAFLAVLPGGAATHAHTVVRAALPPGKINHIILIELENEGYAATFGPNSPATYLNGTLRKEGELLQNYYAIGHPTKSLSS